MAFLSSMSGVQELHLFEIKSKVSATKKRYYTATQFSLYFTTFLWCGVLTSKYYTLPNWLQSAEKNLGATIRYSKKRNIKNRQSRWKEGYRRLSCIEHLPILREYKARVIVSGVFPQCLHGIKAELVTDKTWFPLRSKVVKALGFRFTRNPFLACVVSTKKIVDPLFIAINNGLRLCRLIARHAP